VWAAVSPLAQQSFKGDGGTVETNAIRRKRARGVDEAYRSDIGERSTQNAAARLAGENFGEPRTTKALRSKSHGDHYGLDGSGIRLGSAPSAAERSANLCHLTARNGLPN
jgi:hypothetical protein